MVGRHRRAPGPTHGRVCDGSGRIALIELTEPLSVKTPFPWKTPRVAISVEDVDAFLNAVSQSSGVPVEPGIAAR